MQERVVVAVASPALLGGGTFACQMITSETVKTKLIRTYGTAAVMDCHLLKLGAGEYQVVF